MHKRFLTTILLSTCLTLAVNAQITWTKKDGPYGGGIQRLAVHPTTFTVYAISDDGVLYRSTDNAQTWADFRPALVAAANEVGNISDVMITSDGTVWLLTFSNLYKSLDDGVTFTKVNSGTGAANGGFDSGSRLHKNVNTGTFYVSGYHYSDGKYTVYRSTNSGVSWTKAHQGRNFSQIVSASNGTVFAVESNSMYKSTNDGSVFTAEISPAPSDVITNSVSLTSKSDGSQIILVTGSSAIYSMVTPFSTWSLTAETGIADQTTYGPGAVIRYTPDNSLILLADNSNNKFYTRATASSTWVPQNTTFPSSDADDAVVIAAKDNSNFYVGTAYEGVWKTFNAGAGWSEVNTGITATRSTRNLVVADNGAVIVAGSRPYMSTDFGSTWSRPFVTTNTYADFTAFKASTGSPRPIVLLSQYGPSFRTTNNGSSWTQIAAAPSSRFTSPNGTKILSYDNSTMSYSSNQGTSWQSLTLTGLPTSIYTQYVTMDNSTVPIVFSVLYDYSVNPAVLKVYKITLNSSTPTSGSAAPISLSTIGVTDIYDIEYYNNAIYILGQGSSGRVLSISTDGGTTWTQKAAPTSTYDLDIDRSTGYIFLVRTTSTGYTINISRDNGTSYLATSVNLLVGRVNYYGVAVDPNSGYAYAGFDGSAMFRTENGVILPAAPTSLQVSAKSTDRLTLSWIDNATNEDNFIIEKQVGANFVQITDEGSGFNTGTTLRTEISGLSPDTEYTFRVSASNSAGTASATVTTTTLASCASTIPDNRSWSGNVNGSTPLTNVGIVSKGQGLFYITDVANGAPGTSGVVPMLFQESCNSTYLAYDYPLFANGNGTWNSGTNTLTLNWITASDPISTGLVTLTVNGTDPTPQPPTLPSATIYDAGSIEVSWTGSLFATSYTIERSTSNTFATIQQTFSANYPATRYRDNTALVQGTTYYYRIKGVNNSGTSAPTSIVSVNFVKPNFALSGSPVEVVNGANSAGTYWADFNNDGFDDLIITKFIIQPGVSGLPNIYKNDGAGGFTAVGAESGIEPSAYISATIGDYDNDGNVDIFLGSSGSQNYLYKGNGDFTFTKVVSPMDTNSPNGFEEVDLATVWFDANNDGLLDIMNYTQENSTIKYFVQSPAGTFTKQTTGDIAALTSTGALSLWIDYDDDGKQDLYMGENGSMLTNKLYKNNGDGTLTKLTGAPFDTDVGTRSYGAAWGDYNNDSHMDLFISSQSTSLANILYKNNGDGTFTKQSLSPVTDVKSGPASYGAVWADINNDTFLDLIVANITGENFFFINNNGTGFTKVTNEKITDIKLNNFSIAAADYNHDGFVDLALSSVDPVGFESPIPSSVNNLLFKNINATGNWIQFKLKGTTSNRSAIGARIFVTAGGKTQIREIQATSSFLSQNSHLVHFGLGSATSITSVQIKWPSGAVQSVPGLSINTINTVTEDVTGPVISIQGPANNAANVAVDTKLSITLDEGATAVAGKNLVIREAPGGPVVATLPVTAAEVSDKTYTFTLPAALDGPKQYAVAIDAGAFVDVYNNQSNALEFAEWKFTTASPPDVTPPVITFNPAASVDKSSLPGSIKAVIVDDKGVSDAKLMYRPISGSTFTESTGTLSNATTNEYTFSVASTGFDATGIEYYFTATDAVPNTGRSPSGTGYHHTYLKYSSADTKIPTNLVGTGGTKESWKVIAVPFEPTNKDVTAIFDELTQTLTNQKDFRIITYKDDQNWAEYPGNFTQINRGVGYFINLKTATELAIGDNLVPPSNSRSNLFKLNLKKGWNMIGNPYLTPIQWSDVAALNGLTGTDATLIKYVSGNYASSPTLAAYEGGFVFMANDKNDVEIPFQGQTSAGGRVADIFGDDDWVVPMTLTIGNTVNTFAGVGMHSHASQSFDRFDNVNTPRFFDYAEINFPHAEHFAQNFARDIVPNSNSHTWQFTIDSNLPDAAVLSWDAEIHPTDKDLYLYDITTQTPVNMKETGSYSFDPNVSRTFRIYYGENALLKIMPSRVNLGAAYPNPLSKATTIPFSIPDGKGQMKVRLEVFDITGRSVGTLANGEFAPGFYRKEWQPHESIVDGLYFYRLLAGDEVLTGKVVLKK